MFSNEKRRVRIGKHPQCEILISETGVSRIQCSLTYVNGEGWKIKDGDDSKLSTNGTWLYVNEPIQLLNDTIFKAGKTIFKAQLHH